MKETEITKHESFGQIRFSRTTGGSTRFYGSELPQDHYISIEVHHSEIQRDLTDDKYYNTGAPILRARMSSGQFSELITSLNMGSGVPCTLERINGLPISDLPYNESRKDFVHRKFEDRMKEFSQKLKDKQAKAKELIKKKSLSKEDMFQLNLHIEWLTQEVSSNIPFFAKCFQETMDEVVFEAKTEVENAIQHKISTLGLEELHKQQNLLDKP